jgi:small subunit ribosomal protein S6
MRLKKLFTKTPSVFGYYMHEGAKLLNHSNFLAKRLTLGGRYDIIQSVILVRARRGLNPEGGVLKMAKTSETYEMMAVFSLKNGEEAAKELTEKFKGLIEANGTLTSVNEWGKRRLAYVIDYQNEGYYVLYTFESSPEFPAEIERVVNITEGVLRSLVTVKNPENERPPYERKETRKEEPREKGKAEEE